MSVLSILATVFGVVGSVAMFPQVYRIFKRKSAKDISISSYAFLLAAGVIWTLYGFELQDLPLIVTNLLGSLTVVGVVAGWFLYGR